MGTETTHAPHRIETVDASVEPAGRALASIPGDGTSPRQLMAALREFMGATVELVGIGIELDGEGAALSRSHAVCRHCADESPGLHARCAEGVKPELSPGASRICGRGHRIMCHEDGLRVVLPKTLAISGGSARRSGTLASGRLGRFLASLRPLMDGIAGLADDDAVGLVMACGVPGVLGGDHLDLAGGRPGRVDPLLASTVRSLVAAVDAKDPYTRGHSERVQIVASALGASMALDAAMTTDLYWAALLHDTGKIGIPDAILNKFESLDDDEMEAMRQHPVLGAEILAPLDWLEAALLGIRHHHERIDGQGYPDGLAGDEIPLIARIIAVADTFDAMISRRHYRLERSPGEALEEMIDVAGRQLDLEVVAVFESHFDSICDAVRGATHVAEGLADAGQPAGASMRPAA